MQQNNHHNIEDEQLRRLFADFNPPISPASRFMERLERDMQRVEMVKEATLRLQRRNRVAVVLAALAGFVAGVVFMALYPVSANGWRKCVLPFRSSRQKRAT